MSILSITIALVSMIACLRLLTFKRRGDKHKRNAAFSAWLVCCLLVAIATRSITGDIPNDLIIQLLMLAVLIVFTVRIFQTHGNIAHLLKLKGHRHA